jgi:hypothetical protein
MGGHRSTVQVRLDEGEPAWSEDAQGLGQGPAGWAMCSQTANDTIRSKVSASKSLAAVKPPRT